MLIEHQLSVSRYTLVSYHTMEKNAIILILTKNH